MATIKLSRDFMMDKVMDTDVVISDEIIDQRRWSTTHELIFKHEELIYRTYYSHGSTECQDERPWENEPEVECTEMQAVMKIVFVYEPTK